MKISGSRMLPVLLLVSALSMLAFSLVTMNIEMLLFSFLLLLWWCARTQIFLHLEGWTLDLVFIAIGTVGAFYLELFASPELRAAFAAHYVHFLSIAAIVAFALWWLLAPLDEG